MPKKSIIMGKIKILSYFSLVWKQLERWIAINKLPLSIALLVSLLYVVLFDVGVREFSGMALVWKILYTTVQIFLFTLLLSRLKYVGGIIFALANVIVIVLQYAKIVFSLDLSPAIVNATFQTTWNEVFPLINIYIVLAISACLSLSFLYINWLNRKLIVAHNWWCLGGWLGLYVFYLLLPGMFAYKQPWVLCNTMTREILENPFLREHAEREYSWLWKKNVREHFLSPAFKYNRILSYTRDYFKNIDTQDPAVLASHAEREDEPMVFVLVIGESLRADHFSLFGYARETNPLLSKIPNLYGFPRFYSFQTGTSSSIYGILTNADIEHPHATMKSFASVLKKHKFKCSLITSNYGVMTFFTAAHIQPSFTTFADSVTDCEYGNTPALKALSQAVNSSPRQLVVLQNGMGHFPYYCDERYKKYQPCDFNGDPPFQKKETMERMLNAYDNCVIGIDDFLARSIAILKDKRAVLLFVSDHGESFGENGRWSHCGPLTCREQRHIAACIWFSDKYRATNARQVENILSHRNQPLSHDHIYHTVISVCDIQSQVQNPKLDLTNPEIETAKEP